MRRVLFALIVAVVAWLPSAASAQTLRASIAPAVHAYLAEHPQAPGDAADTLVTDKAMIAAEWIFISSQAMHVTYAAVQENQNAQATTQTIVVGITSTAGTLALAKLLPARWQRFAALIAVGVATGIIDGRKIVQQVRAPK